MATKKSKKTKTSKGGKKVIYSNTTAAKEVIHASCDLCGEGLGKPCTNPDGSKASSIHASRRKAYANTSQPGSSVTTPVEETESAGVNKL